MKRAGVFLTSFALVFAVGFSIGRLTAPDRDSADSRIARVARVIDGDTIELEGGRRVRYIGVDTPESVDRRRGVQCFGREAAEKNRELVEGKTVRLERDVSDRDKFGRMLRYVWVGDTLVNRELVRLGYANAYRHPPDVARADEFREAEREAREANRGLWGACPQPAVKGRAREPKR